LLLQMQIRPGSLNVHLDLLHQCEPIECVGQKIRHKRPLKRGCSGSQMLPLPRDLWRDIRHEASRTLKDLQAQLPHAVVSAKKFPNKPEDESMFSFDHDDVSQPLYVYQPVLSFVLDGSDEVSCCTITVRATGIIAHNAMIEDKSVSQIDAPTDQRPKEAAVAISPPLLQPHYPVLEGPPNPPVLCRARTDPTPKRVDVWNGDDASASPDGGFEPKKIDHWQCGVAGLQQPPASSSLFAEATAGKLLTEAGVAMDTGGSGVSAGAAELHKQGHAEHSAGLLWGADDSIWEPDKSLRAPGASGAPRPPGHYRPPGPCGLPGSADGMWQDSSAPWAMNWGGWHPMFPGPPGGAEARPQTGSALEESSNNHGWDMDARHCDKTPVSGWLQPGLS